MAALRHPSPAPVVLADAHRVRVTADVLVANRRLARPHAPGVAVLELGAEGEIIGGARGGLLVERELLLLATGRERAPALRRMLLVRVASARAVPLRRVAAMGERRRALGTMTLPGA